jgi:hypothetical protein
MYTFFSWKNVGIVDATNQLSFPGKEKTIYKTVDSLPFIFSRGLGLTVVGCLEDPRIPTDYQECYAVLSENADKAILKSIFGGIASMNLAEQLR